MNMKKYERADYGNVRSIKMSKEKCIGETGQYQLTETQNKNNNKTSNKGKRAP